MVICNILESLLVFVVPPRNEASPPILLQLIHGLLLLWCMELSCPGGEELLDWVPADGTVHLALMIWMRFFNTVSWMCKLPRRCLSYHGWTIIKYSYMLGDCQILAFSANVFGGWLCGGELSLECVASI